MRVFDLVGGTHGQRPGMRVAVIGTCRVHDPFEELVKLGRAVRVWANDTIVTNSFGEALQAFRYTRGEIDIPKSLHPFVFHGLGPPDRDTRDVSILASADVMIVEISERRQLCHGPYFFNLNYFYTHFVSKYGAPVLPWYRAFAAGNVTEEIIEATLAALKASGDRSPAEMVLLEAILRQTHGKYSDAETASQTLREIMFDRDKKWILVSHFVVPGLAGTQMRDRAELIDLLRATASQEGITMLDPSPLVEKHGREVALASGGKDIYHFSPKFYEPLADQMLDAADLRGAPAGMAAGNAAAVAATHRINKTLLAVHQRRVAEFGPDESGLFSHYNHLLNEGKIAGENTATLANLIANLLPRFDRYHVLRAGLGELAFTLATLGLPSSGFDQDRKRFTAMIAGFSRLCEEDGEIASRLSLGMEAIPSVPPNERTLCVAVHLLGFKTYDQSKHLAKLTAYDALLIEPRLFLEQRDSTDDQQRVVEVLRFMGFKKIREFPSLGLVYLAKPGVIDTQKDGAAAAQVAPIGAR